MASCINKVPDCKDDRKVLFGAVIGNANKSEGGSEAHIYPQDCPFAVWAYELPSTTDWETSSSFAHSVIEGEHTRYHNGHWCTEEMHLWPERSSMLNFFAFSPADAEAEFSLEKGVNFEGFSIERDREFLCSVPVNDAQKPDMDATVNLVFESPLCEVEIYAYSSSEDGVELYIRDIELLNLCTTADFHSLPQAEWTELANPKTLYAFNGNCALEDKPVMVVGGLEIIPQDIRLLVRYCFRNPGSDEMEQREVTLSLGKVMRPLAGAARSYTLKITQESVEILNPTEEYED